MFFALKTCLWSYTPFYTISSLSTFLSLHILKKNAGRMLVSTELSVQVSIVNLDEDDLYTKLFLIEDNTGRRRYVSPPNTVGIITLYTYGCKILFHGLSEDNNVFSRLRDPKHFFYTCEATSIIAEGVHALIFQIERGMNMKEMLLRNVTLIKRIIYYNLNRNKERNY